MQTFDTPAPIAAVLTIPAGRIQLLATDQTVTTVQVEPADASKRRDVTAAEQTTVDYTDGVLRIHTHAGENQYFRSTGSVAVTVALPAGSRVQATAAAAEFHTAGRLGEVAIEGAYQHITIEHAASVRLTAVDGDVEVGRLDGPARINTARDDIRITEAVRGEVVLATQSGDISVAAAPGVSASLDAGTSYGRITNTLKNNGVTELALHTTTAYGDITAHAL